jgi:hypothetical protein
VCNFIGCESPATRNFRCSICGYELFLCDVHGPPDVCFTCNRGDFTLYQRLQPVVEKEEKEKEKEKEKENVNEVVQSVVDNRIEIEDYDLEDVEETTTSCGLRGTSELAWCESTDDLALSLEICKNVHVRIGHSFGAMSIREAYLREEAGTTVWEGAASGPNNALCELRILLVNERCEALQIAVRFRDKNGRHLLFRSTGGCVLQQDPQDLSKVLVRNHDCQCTASDGYLSQETYAHVGSYSFFDQIDDAYDEPRLMTGDHYVKHHETEYREVVEASDNAQLYHHSEQAIFKLLYDYPNVVADAILDVITNLNSGFFKDLKELPLVAALVLDVFTTRTACVDCLKAGRSTRTKSVHFFSQALKDVVKTLSGKVGVSKNVRTHLRFAAAVAFLGCPTRKVLEGLEKTTTSAMMHALPSENIKLTSLSEDEPAIVFVNVAVTANSPSCLQVLTTGSASRERTEVDRALRITRELSNITRIDQIPLAVAKSQLEHATSKVVMALRLYLKLEPNVNDIAGLYQLGLDTVPLAPRLECVLEVAVVNEIADLDIIYAILRNYAAFFQGQRNTPKPFDAGGLLTIIDLALRDIFKLGAVSKLALKKIIVLGPKITKEHADLAKDFVLEIKKEIVHALSQNTATGENRARNLAIEFNLLDFYKEAKKK